MSGNSHERYEELAVGHALSALEPDEEEHFLAHLPSCAICQRALADHRETLAHLAYAADPAEPPLAVLQGIRAEVGAQPRVPHLASRRLSRPARALVAVAAAAALALSGGVATLLLHHPGSSGTTVVQALQGLHGAPPVPLEGSAGRPVAYAVVEPDQTVALVVDGLEPNDSRSSVYVLWGKARSGTVHAVGSFDVRGTGVEVIRGLPLGGGVGSLAGFAITREPGRQAPARPTLPPVASGTLPA